MTAFTIVGIYVATLALLWAVIALADRVVSWWKAGPSWELLLLAAINRWSKRYGVFFHANGVWVENWTRARPLPDPNEPTLTDADIRRIEVFGEVWRQT